MSVDVEAIQRTAVVTGAASPRGIGFATARRFAKEGWGVAILDIDESGTERAAQRIQEEFGVPVLGIFVDVTSKESVDLAADKVKGSSLPPVGALANVAGMPSPVPFLDVDLELWHRVLDVNLTGTFLALRG